MPPSRALVEFLLDRGVSGFFVCGGTGEGLLLTPAERRAILEATVDQTAGRAAVIAHIGALATQEAQALAAHAAELESGRGGGRAARLLQGRPRRALLSTIG